MLKFCVFCVWKVNSTTILSINKDESRRNFHWCLIRTRGRRMSKNKFGTEFRILRSLLTEYRISNTECLLTGRLKKLVWIHLKIIYWKYNKRIYILGIPYSLVFHTAQQFCYSSDDHWKFEIRNSAKFGFSPNFGKWHSVSEFEEQNSAVCSNIRPFDPRTNNFSQSWHGDKRLRCQV